MAETGSKRTDIRLSLSLIFQSVWLKGLGIAGDDRQFVLADAAIDGDSVIVSSPEIPDPKHVVYAWAINPIISLYNKEGLPASPFRTWTDPPPKDYKDFTEPKTEFESETNLTGREKETLR